MGGHHRWADTRANRAFRDATGLERHAGLWCGCPLIECCHNEDADEGDRWRISAEELGCRFAGQHVHSGSPASGYTQPWEPGDESWRDSWMPAGRMSR